MATLIRAGANVKAANRYEMTPLALAAVNGDVAIVDGAAQRRRRAELRACRRRDGADGGRADRAAAAVKALLARGARVNAAEKTLGQTALMWAAAENHADAVKVLVEAGADVNQRSTALTFPPFKWGVNGMVSTVLPKGSWTPADVRGAAELGGGGTGARGGRGRRQRHRSGWGDAAPHRASPTPTTTWRMRCST